VFEEREKVGVVVVVGGGDVLREKEREF